MRPESDIKDIRILTEVPGIDGWVVEMRYKDGKHVSMGIDRGASSTLYETFISIRRQLDSVPPKLPGEAPM